MTSNFGKKQARIQFVLIQLAEWKGTAVDEIKRASCARASEISFPRPWPSRRWGHSALVWRNPRRLLLTTLRSIGASPHAAVPLCFRWAFTAAAMLCVAHDIVGVGTIVTLFRLQDTTGSTLAEEHKSFASKTECHKVLWEAARARQQNSWAPLKNRPLQNRTRVPHVERVPHVQRPYVVPFRLRPPHPSSHRHYGHGLHPLIAPGVFRSGCFLGTVITSDWAIGAHVSVGFVLSPHSPRIQIEIDGAWVSQTLPQSNAPESLRVQAIPLLGSLCYSRYVYRICSGLTTTFIQADRKALAPGNDDIRTTLAGHLRIGTEFDIAGPFSLRFDAYAHLRFWERTFGSELATLETQSPLGAGVVAMGVWSFE